MFPMAPTPREGTRVQDSASSLAKPLVLVVEDEAALATMLRYNLEKQGFRVEEAGDGQEALTRIAETGETPVFKSFFKVWEEPKKRTLEEKKAGKPVARPPEVESLFKQVAQAEGELAQSILACSVLTCAIDDL